VNTTGKQIRKARVIWKGWVPDTDPRYSGGWNYLGGKNLNPHSAKPSREHVKPPPLDLGQ
jgi:hypothetical protein